MNGANLDMYGFEKYLNLKLLSFRAYIDIDSQISIIRVCFTFANSLRVGLMLS